MGILACQSLRSVFCLSVWPWEVGTARAPPMAHSSPHSGSPPVRPLCWVFHTLSPPQSPGWAPRAGHGLRASTSSRTMHPWPAACYPQRSPWPISTSAVASCKHDHLPPSLPTPARPPGPTKRGLLRAVWSPLPSPRGLRVALGTGRIHTHSFNLVATQSVPVPGLCKLHQAQREGVRSRVGRGHVQCGSRAGVTCSVGHVQGSRAACVTCRGHVQRGSRAGVTCSVRRVQGSRAACVACRGHVQRASRAAVTCSVRRVQGSRAACLRPMQAECRVRAPVLTGVCKLQRAECERYGWPVASGLCLCIRGTRSRPSTRSTTRTSCGHTDGFTAPWCLGRWTTPPLVIAGPALGRRYLWPGLRNCQV